MSKETEFHPRRHRGHADLRHRILEIAKELSATLGTDFLQSAVRHLATTLQADYVYIGELTGASGDQLRTLAVFSRQEAPQHFESSLSGTASVQVLSDGSFARAREVSRLFPLDPLLKSLDAEGYIGFRLCNSVAQPIGIAAMISKTGFEHIHVAKAVLETFVPRAAVELERKRANDMHRENEERHQAFVQTNPDAMWRIELEQPVPLSLTEEEQIDRIYRFGYLAECNDAFARLTGVGSSDELLGARFGDIVPLVNPAAREELRSAVKSGFRHAVVETTRQDGPGGRNYRLRSQFAIVDHGELQRIWGTTRDITALRLAEISLAASEKRFREVLEGIQFPAVMLDLHGMITFANESFLRLAQRTMAEMSALTWLNGVISEDESEVWKSALPPDERRGHAGVHFEGTIIPREGSPSTISWDTISLHDQENRLTGLAAIGRDITLQKTLEIEIRQAQKLESIGRLAAGVAHDFNNLLTVVMSQVDELLQQTTETDPGRQGLSAIANAAAQCARLTGQLLTFGRKQHLQPVLLNLNDVIIGQEKIIRTLVKDDISLIFDLASPLPLVYADPTQMERALANLVTNGRDAMPHGGILIIATSHLTIGSEDTAYPRVKTGDYVRLSVSDSGVGLTEEVRGHMFEPFFTTKGPGKGTGLGLSTVYGIVAQSDGHVAVYGEPGRGTRFDILLPVPLLGKNPADTTK